MTDGLGGASAPPLPSWRIIDAKRQTTNTKRVADPDVLKRYSLAFGAAVQSREQADPVLVLSDCNRFNHNPFYDGYAR